MWNNRINMLLISALMVCSCEKKKPVAQENRKVVIELVKPYEREMTLSYPGKVVSADHAELAFKVAGRIAQLLVKKGESVYKGEVIAILDKVQYELQYEATKVEYEQVKREVSRLETLYRNNSLTESDYEKAIAGVERLEKLLALHEQALNDCELRAPWTGNVDEIHFNNDEIVGAGTPIVSFISHDRLNVELDVPYSSFRSMRIGAICKGYDRYNLEDTIVLSVTELGYKANRNQLFPVVLSIDTETSLRSGMNLIVEVNESSLVDESAFVAVPLSSLFSVDGKNYVWRVLKGRAISSEVKPSAIDKDGYVAILEGLSIGDTIVRAGVHSISEGEYVDVVSSKSKSNVGGIL